MNLFNELEKELLVMIWQKIKKSPFGSIELFFFMVVLSVALSYITKSKTDFSIIIIELVLIVVATALAINLYYRKLFVDPKSSIISAFAGLHWGWAKKPIVLKIVALLIFSLSAINMFVFYVEASQVAEVLDPEQAAKAAKDTADAVNAGFYPMYFMVASFGVAVDSYILSHWGVSVFFALVGTKHSIADYCEDTLKLQASYYQHSVIKLSVIPSTAIVFIGAISEVELRYVTVMFVGVFMAAAIAHAKGDRPKQKEKKSQLSGNMAFDF